ncbi:hypothetical protein VOLCADRAFT_91527 [Volvox carteri f. nagariensis]|uniref:Uncharacterized protein n=1 Tax=Volvox carteri f. nagariensis TaxID=3068 RepID=D8TXB2_VOLCA|nr:uncharacterized protein VOLCADRAFT_91527 [Volvox carteri f. nagariensis]EFJ47976.1 hypothetical protein VOLCADRAFT_91527 [Volvox carteri f. nagariensis]|eukprot:XP_002951082.1 hypothetical protein VOLCADRAFT_91527 [Volvox carteri f. nagariensis]
MIGASINGRMWTSDMGASQNVLHEREEEPVGAVEAGADAMGLSSRGASLAPPAKAPGPKDFIVLPSPPPSGGSAAIPGLVLDTAAAVTAIVGRCSACSCASGCSGSRSGCVCNGGSSGGAGILLISGIATASSAESRLFHVAKTPRHGPRSTFPGYLNWSLVEKKMEATEVEATEVEATELEAAEVETAAGLKPAVPSQRDLRRPAVSG